MKSNIARIAHMASGRKAPFNVGDYVTAIARDGRVTKLRGVVTLVHTPLDANFTGGIDYDPYEFDVDWTDNNAPMWGCVVCLKRLPVDPDAPGIPGRFGNLHGPNCCRGSMSRLQKHPIRVTEHEIKLVSAVDLLGELNSDV